MLYYYLLFVFLGNLAAGANRNIKEKELIIIIII